MFAHLAPGVSLAGELIGGLRAEVRAEESDDEARRQRRGKADAEAPASVLDAPASWLI